MVLLGDLTLGASVAVQLSKPLLKQELETALVAVVFAPTVNFTTVLMILCYCKLQKQLPTSPPPTSYTPGAASIQKS